MAISTMGRENSSPNLEPLYSQGCKITLGAKSGLRPPTFAEARELVMAKRASDRILQPSAAVAIQHAWKVFKHRKAAAASEREAAVVSIQRAWAQHAIIKAEAALSERRASTLIQGAWRRSTATEKYKQTRQAAITIATAYRGLAQRKRFAEMRQMLLDPLHRLQAAARGMLARKRLRSALWATILIQTSWRRVSDQVLRRRLARAADSLRKGGSLAKYRKHGAVPAARERHAKYVWVSADLQKLHWAPSEAQRGDESAVRTLPMASITAVTDGVKTRLMKKMERRAAAANDPLRTISFGKRTISFGSKQVAPAAEPLSGRSFGRSLLRKPLTLDESCAFSIFCAERVLDFVAEDKATRDLWLRDLKCVLTYAHHFDLTEAKRSVQQLAVGQQAAALVMSSSDSDEELDEESE